VEEHRTQAPDQAPPEGPEESRAAVVRGHPEGRGHLALHYVRGALMGTADMVPGVSGGTVALVVGVYERLVQSLRAATTAPVALVRGDRPRAREQLLLVEWRLVLPLVAGILSAIALGSGIVPPLLEEHPLQTSALFFGLILGSLIVPWRLIGDPGRREAALVLLAAAAAFVLVGLPDRELADPVLPLVFASAAIAICAMVLPGISGAYLLLLIGVYRATLEAVHDRDVLYVAVFAAGAVTGLALFARLLARLLERHHATTMAALLGLMIGSLRALWPWADDDRTLQAPRDAGEVLTASLYAAVGLTVVLALVALAAGRRSR
jgi:putative membrane protein